MTSLLPTFSLLFIFPLYSPPPLSSPQVFAKIPSIPVFTSGKKFHFLIAKFPRTCYPCNRGCVNISITNIGGWRCKEVYSMASENNLGRSEDIIKERTLYQPTCNILRHVSLLIILLLFFAQWLSILLKIFFV